MGGLAQDALHGSHLEKGLAADPVSCRWAASFLNCGGTTTLPGRQVGVGVSPTLDAPAA
jgi:hypothetical protein